MSIAGTGQSGCRNGLVTDLPSPRACAGLMHGAVRLATVRFDSGASSTSCTHVAPGQASRGATCRIADAKVTELSSGERFDSPSVFTVHSGSAFLRGGRMLCRVVDRPLGAC